MTYRLTQTLKSQLIIYIVVAALAITTPQFDARAEAEGDSGFYFMLEGRLAFPESDATPYLETVGPSSDLNVEEVDTGLGGGGRIGGAYRTKQWDFGIFYSGLNLDGDSSLSASPNVLRAILGTSTVGWYAAEAEAEMTYHVVDFEVGYNLKLGQTDVRLFGGVRYSNFDQDVNTFFYYIPNVTIMEERDVDFLGVGPRLGASARANILGSFGGTASISGGVLFGDQDTLTTQTGSQGNYQISRSDFRSAGFVDGELGITYNQALGKTSSIILVLGYRAEAWFDVNNTRSEPPTRSGNLYGSMYADQVFHGPFLRGEIHFD